MKKCFVVAIMTFFIGGCSNAYLNDGYRQNLLKRAAFDMECSEDQLKLTEISRSSSEVVNSYGVTGCDKKAVYVKPNNSNMWILNNDNCEESK